MRNRLTKAALLALIAYWAALFIATHTPQGDVAAFPHADKLAHLAAYGALAWLAAMTLRLRQWPLRRTYVVVFIVCVVYGAVDEWLQQYVGRMTDFQDWLADTAGAALGLVLFAYTHQRVRSLYRAILRRYTSKTGCPT